MGITIYREVRFIMVNDRTKEEQVLDTERTPASFSDYPMPLAKPEPALTAASVVVGSNDPKLPALTKHGQDCADSLALLRMGKKFAETPLARNQTLLGAKADMTKFLFVTGQLDRCEKSLLLKPTLERLKRGVQIEQERKRNKDWNTICRELRMPLGKACDAFYNLQKVRHAIQKPSPVIAVIDVPVGVAKELNQEKMSNGVPA